MRNRYRSRYRNRNRRPSFFVFVETRDFSMKIKGICIALSFMLLSAVAVAQDYYVDITNRTGFTIMYVQVSPGKAKSWEEDVLGFDVLLDGDTQRVNLYGYKSPIFDIRLTDEDGDTYTFW